MESYLNPNEQDDLKSMLYTYLKDKAQRRAGVTSKNEYEGAEDQFAKQMQLRDAGSLLGGLSEAASMAGQIQGKRAESDIIPTVNKDLYGSTQGAYENFRTLRDTEERSNMNDLRVADYLSGLDRRKFEEDKYKDLEPRRKLEMQLMQKKLASEPAMKRRLESDLVGPGGEPVLLDAAGNPTTLPGYKMREKPQAMGSMSIVPGFSGENKVLMKDAQGNLVARDLPTGIKSIPKAGASSQMNVTQSKKMGVFKIGEMAEQQYNAAVQKGIKSGEWNPTSYGDWIDNARLAPNFMKNSAAIEAMAAMNSWVDSFLRDESGAAIPDSERGAYFKIYFPQPGDSPQTVQNKARLRQQKMMNAKEAAGASSESMNGKEILKKQYSPSRNQTKIIYSDGSEEVVDGRQ